MGKTPEEIFKVSEKHKRDDLSVKNLAAAAEFHAKRANEKVSDTQYDVEKSHDENDQERLDCHVDEDAPDDSKIDEQLTIRGHLPLYCRRR